MNRLPNVTKNILLINVLIWIVDSMFRQRGIQLLDIFGLHYFTASNFYFWQIFTYMFFHANFSHLFCNMFAVFMFGAIIEQSWGQRRTLIYYLVCGCGAALMQEMVWMIKINSLLSSYDAMSVYANYVNQVVTIGASGAVFGIMFAFGWLFPNVPMFILFFPVPIAARKFVILYAIIELVAGFAPIQGDNVAHFAHLGGMLFGWLLLLWWRNGYRWKNRFFKNRYENHSDSIYNDYHYKKNLD